MLRRILVVVLILVVTATLYLTLWPVPIDPVAWQPPSAPEMVGPYAPNSDLAPSRRLLADFGRGPEDVAFDDAGSLYTGFSDGRIVRVPIAGGTPEVVANTGGRPLGMVFDAAGNLIVADASRGLVTVSSDGKVMTLADGAGGVPFAFADDLDIAPDGIVYFSDASDTFGYGQDALDIIEHRGRGRLLAYDPATGETRVVLDGLQFANGVAVSKDGSSVLVAETGSYRVVRVWLSGPDAGRKDFLIENLPGFPDNINFTERGTIWIALPSPRIASVDRMAPNPFLRKLVMRLPQSMRPAPIRYGLVLEISAGGTPIRSLHDPTGEVAFVASVMERDGSLFLGSYEEPSLVVVDLGSG